jgi:outer membrane protein OmpA-like peptidoglycan-associated protein
MTQRREPVPHRSSGPVRPVRRPDPATRPAAGGREGKAIEPATRRTMESRFGEDFSSVRVHTEADAAAAADLSGAQAMTVGDDIAFGPGRYAPATAAGDVLLDHELGHVQKERHGAPPAVRLQPKGQPVVPGSSAEPERKLHLDPDIGKLSLGLSTLDEFDFNESTLKPAHQAKIADVAAKLTMLLAKMPGSRITVSGHADLVGGEDVNLRVGQRRADAVERALVEAGVPAVSIHSSSEGKRAPVVKKAGADGRNRRVEVRFEGELIVPGPLGGPSLGTSGRLTPPGDAPRRVDLFPPTLTSPGSVGAPQTLKPGPLSKPADEPKAGEGPARPAKAGDALKALAARPDVKKWLDGVKEDQLRKFDKGTTVGEKVLVGTFVATIVGGGVAGASTDPAARRLMLDIVDGAEIPVPGVPWLKLKAHTAGGGLGGGVVLDVLKLGNP